jgi:hypothetical protein
MSTEVFTRVAMHPISSTWDLSRQWWVDGPRLQQLYFYICTHQKSVQRVTLTPNMVSIDILREVCWASFEYSFGIFSLFKYVRGTFTLELEGIWDQGSSYEWNSLRRDLHWYVQLGCPTLILLIFHTILNIYVITIQDLFSSTMVVIQMNLESYKFLWYDPPQVIFMCKEAT